MRLILTLFISVTLGLSSGKAQVLGKESNVLSLKRNAIYGSLGIGLMYVTSSAYYERIIGNGIADYNIETFIRTGFINSVGLLYCNSFSLEGGLLWGKGLSTMTELSFGWHPSLDDVMDFKPYGGSVAFRYQNPGGIFIFRLGAGYPEILFIGLGLSF